MSNFLKYLTVGGCVGAVIYAVIKYHKDEQFKEKVDDISETVKDTGKKCATKVIRTAAKHPIATIATAWVVGAFWHACTHRPLECQNDTYYDLTNDSDTDISDTWEKNSSKENMINDVMNNPDNYVVISKKDYNALVDDANSVKAIKADAESTTNWNESYRDAWTVAKHLAETIDLDDNEMYIIEKHDGKRILSHLVDGEGCYPEEAS